MHEPLRFWFRPYSIYPSTNPNPNRNYDFKDNAVKLNYKNYSCISEPSKPIACLRSPTSLLLAPAGFGIVIAILLAFSPDKAEGCYQRPAHKGTAATVIYTAFVTLALALYVYHTLRENDDDLSTCFLPLSIGIATLLGYYGTVYFFLNRLDPHSFSGDFKDDLLDQFITFVYYSITTFATAQDGDIKPTTLGAKSLVSMEILAFIYIFTLGLVIFTSS